MGNLKVKRRDMPRQSRTPNKRQQRKAHLDKILAPLIRQTSKLSKGQRRRNLKGRPPIKGVRG